MPRPPVIAHHLIWAAYGTWLPNDPRGSGSQTVRAGWLADLGEVYHGRKRIQPQRTEVRQFYGEAEPRLQHDVLRFDRAQRDAIAAAFADLIARTPYTCYACAIMPDHVHLVIRKHRHLAEDMIDNLQAASRSRLSAEHQVPPNHPIWTVGGWKKFLSTPQRVRETIAYVEKNPLKEGLPAQHWPFVATYDGWPYHRRR